MFFSQERRPKIKEENPDAQFGDITKQLGKEWTDMSAADKKRYEAIVTEQDKALEAKIKEDGYTGTLKEWISEHRKPRKSKEDGEKKGKKKKLGYDTGVDHHRV